MKRTLRSALAIGLMVLVGAPLSAQQATLRLAPPEHATKGEQVVVTLRDGREIQGEIGGWIDDVGFHVRPSDGAAYLIHPEHIVVMRDAATGRTVDVPLRKKPSALSGQTKFLIGLGIAVGAFLLLGRANLAGG